MAEDEKDRAHIVESKAPKAGTKKLLEHQNIDIDPKTQDELNKPLEVSEKFDAEDEKFLEMLLQKIKSGEIELYTPDTLVNHEVYDKLDEKARGKADFDAVNLLGSIREINNLCNSGYKDTFQTQNMVHRIRITKERLEKIAGDIYII